MIFLFFRTEYHIMVWLYKEKIETFVLQKMKEGA